MNLAENQQGICRTHTLCFLFLSRIRNLMSVPSVFPFAENTVNRKIHIHNIGKNRYAHPIKYAQLIFVHGW